MVPYISINWATIQVIVLHCVCMCIFTFMCIFLSVCVYMGVGNPPVRTQSSNEQEQESLDEGLKNGLKQKELVTQHGDLAEKVQHHASVPEMR